MALTREQHITAPKQVVDQSGRVYRLGKEIGSGGQGSVFLCDDGKLAVKLLHSTKAEQFRQYEKQIAFVRRLAIDGLTLAKPIALLSSPHIGYVMEYLTGMVPFKVLSNIPRSDVSHWYISTGGLRRRLELLARIADSLQQLHSRGLCYGDPSPANIFISEHLSYSEVWMIDCDNLSYTSSPSHASFFTPRYGAPELVRGNAAFNTLTDAHAFAVMAFEALTLTHPLIGDAVTSKGPEFEMKALRGEMPWIESEKDQCNQSKYGIKPRETVLSTRAMQIFRTTFERGLSDATQRPGLHEWRDVLEGAATATVVCHNCHGSFYRGCESCPWCKVNSRPYLLVTLFGIFPEVKKTHGEMESKFELKLNAPIATKIFGSISVSEGESRIISDFHLDGGNSRHERIIVSYAKGVVRVENRDCNDLCSYEQKKGSPINRSAAISIRLSDGESSTYVRYIDMTKHHIGIKFTVAGAKK